MLRERRPPAALQVDARAARVARSGHRAAPRGPLELERLVCVRVGARALRGGHARLDGRRVDVARDRAGRGARAARAPALAQAADGPLPRYGVARAARRRLHLPHRHPLHHSHQLNLPHRPPRAAHAQRVCVIFFWSKLRCLLHLIRCHV